MQILSCELQISVWAVIVSNSQLPDLTPHHFSTVREALTNTINAKAATCSEEEEVKKICMFRLHIRSLLLILKGTSETLYIIGAIKSTFCMLAFNFNV